VTNSLVGSQTSDRVGDADVTALSNGNYVVSSPVWDNGAIVDVGAVTWGDGSSGITGTVTVTNSLVGSQTDDQVGSEGVTALSNGNYVVRSPIWDNALIADAGAITWGNGTGGLTGAVSTFNSLVGSTANDFIGSSFGSEGVIALSNGNYVVRSRYWDNATIVNAGAVTLGNGTGGITGPVSTLNSLVGSQDNDQVGSEGVRVLSNGNYVVRSRYWDNGAILDAGAVTWGDGTSGVAGAVSQANSLVGSLDNDQVGAGGVTVLSSGDYVVNSPYWDNALIVSAGAVSWGFGAKGTFGSISVQNSVRGLAASGGPYMVFQYDAFNRQMVVGRPYENIVTLFRLQDNIFLPVVRK